MYDFEDLLKEIISHKPIDSIEFDNQQQTIQLLKHSNSKSLYREHEPGHIVGNSIILSPDGNDILIHKHIHLNVWCFFGGHADGDPNILNVAIKETVEESGLKDFNPLITDIFDIDVHVIPANKNKKEGEHNHHSLTYLFKSQTNYEANIGPEGAELMWIKIHDMPKYFDGSCYQRIMKKLLQHNS